MPSPRARRPALAGMLRSQRRTPYDLDLRGENRHRASPGAASACPRSIQLARGGEGRWRAQRPGRCAHLPSFLFAMYRNEEYT
jgi:hypothetical protein